MTLRVEHILHRFVAANIRGLQNVTGMGRKYEYDNVSVCPIVQAQTCATCVHPTGVELSGPLSCAQTSWRCLRNNFELDHHPKSENLRTAPGVAAIHQISRHFLACTNEKRR